MHKGTRHVGKVPESLRQSRDLSDRLKQLQKKLAKAIEEEDFEEAAVLAGRRSSKRGRAASQTCQTPDRPWTCTNFLSRRPRARGAKGRMTGLSCPAASGWRAT